MKTRLLITAMTVTVLVMCQQVYAQDEDDPLFTMQHNHYVCGATFDFDERRILTWSQDGTSRLWEVGNEEPLFTMQHVTEEESE